MYGIRAHDFCDTGAVLDQLSYKAHWELVSMLITQELVSSCVCCKCSYAYRSEKQPLQVTLGTPTKRSLENTQLAQWLQFRFRFFFPIEFVYFQWTIPLLFLFTWDMMQPTQSGELYLLLQCNAQFWRSNKIGRNAIFVLQV